MSKLYPRPELEKTWVTWAQKLIRVLLEDKSVESLAVPVYRVDNKPSPIADGQLILVLDETGGPKLEYSSGGAWYKLGGS